MIRPRLAAVCLLLFVASLVTAAGCDKASPVAPVGSVLTISANPAQIAPLGASNITVVARKETGVPVNPGTEIILSATLGTIEPSVRTDDLGVARATLTGDGRIGTASVTALSGAATEVTIDVQVGSSAASITLQATPTVVNEEGATVDLISLVRDDNGQLLADSAVNFLTEIGRLTSGGAAVFTDGAGAARDVLTVTADDLEGVVQETFAVRAQVAGADGVLLEAVFDVAIQRLAPIASFEAVPGVDCALIFTNTTTGREPLTFEWDFQGDGVVDSTDRNPTFDYKSLITDSDGDGTTCPDDPALPVDFPLGDDTQTFSVTMTATNDLGMDTDVQTVTVDPN